MVFFYKPHRKKGILKSLLNKESKTAYTNFLDDLYGVINQYEARRNYFTLFRAI